jgi:hypothetical protein
MFGVVEHDLLLRRRCAVVLQDLGEVLAGHMAGDRAVDWVYDSAGSRLPCGPDFAARHHLQRRWWNQGDLRLFDAILRLRLQRWAQPGMGLQQEPPG